MIIGWLAGAVKILLLWLSWVLFAIQFLFILCNLKFTFLGAQWNCLWISQMGIQSDFDCSLHTRYALHCPLNQCISLFYNFNFMWNCLWNAQMGIQSDSGLMHQVFFFFGF